MPIGVLLWVLSSYGMGYICKNIINYRNHKIFHDIFLKNFIILLIIKKKC